MTPYLIEKKYSLCCGCLSCVKECPTQAITIKKNANGFYMPKLNKSKCIKCGKCKKVCEYCNKTIDNGDFEIEFFALKNKSEEVIQSSSSGGAFLALCKTFFEEYGQKKTVYGSSWDKDFKVEHNGAQSYQECKAFQGSKYAQSSLNDSYMQIKKRLLDGERVLFSGTPCQVEGLNTYLKNIDTSNLITIDLICHGVPSNSTLKDYLSQLENKFNSKIKKVEFKNKKDGWRKPNFRCEFESGEEFIQPIWQTSYGQLYHGRFSVLDCCNDCKYANLNRGADITIGDFWGYDSQKHNLGQEKEGVSICIVNSIKGKEFFEKSKPNFNYLKVSKEEAMQLHLHTSAKPPIEKDKKFYLKLKRKNLPLDLIVVKLNQKAQKQSIITRVKLKIKKILGK